MIVFDHWSVICNYLMNKLDFATATATATVCMADFSRAVVQHASWIILFVFSYSNNTLLLVM